ncbi:MAG TPA: DUF305 domain-containing protein [Vicinamibacterales bacterium]|nr:DUF305 domain-containing protein [Vicinamibacterales bacterium]
MRIRIAVIVLAAAAGASCRTAAVADARPPIVQPGLPGQPSHLIGAAQASDLSKVQYTGADIKFMQGMIGHHAQAVEMVALVPSRTSSEDVKRLALRIDVSQKDEMNMMREWLQARGQQLPDPRAHHMMGATLMPGMLTAEEMEQLAAATGAAFDRLFLAGMIKHHGGAIEMVHDLFATDGAGQTPEIFSYASDVDADQRMEIDRMGSMLKELQK